MQKFEANGETDFHISDYGAHSMFTEVASEP